MTPNQEAEILIKAIRINTMSKLTFIDSKKFTALMTDLLPGIKVEDIKYDLMTKAIKEALKEKGLEVVPAQIAKIL